MVMPRKLPTKNIRIQEGKAKKNLQEAAKKAGMSMTEYVSRWARSLK